MRYGHSLHTNFSLIESIHAWWTVKIMVLSHVAWYDVISMDENFYPFCVFTFWNTNIAIAANQESNSKFL